MDNEIKNILHLLDINVENINELNNFLIPRETLLSDIKYNEIKKLIPELKTSFSSSFLTAFTLISFARLAYFKVERVSSKLQAAGLRAANIKVTELPPNDSCRTLVNLEFL